MFDSTSFLLIQNYYLMNVLHSNSSFEHAMWKHLCHRNVFLLPPLLLCNLFSLYNVNITSEFIYVIEYNRYDFLPYAIHIFVSTWYDYIPWSIHLLVYTCYNHIPYFMYWIFSTRVFHSKHNCLINHNTFVQYKTGYRTRIWIQIIFFIVSYSKYTFSLALRTLLLSQYQYSSVHVHIHTIFVRIYVIFCILIPLLIPY